MNQFHLVGRISNIETIFTPNTQTQITRVNIGCKKLNKTNWFNDLELWETTAKLFTKVCQIGALVSVTGYYKLKQWQDENNNDRQKLVMRIESFQLLANGKTQTQEETTNTDSVVKNEVEEEYIPVAVTPVPQDDYGFGESHYTYDTEDWDEIPF